VIVNNPNLGILKLSTCGLLGDSIAKLFWSFSMLKSLETLQLSFCNLLHIKNISCTLPNNDNIPEEEMLQPSTSILDGCNQLTELAMCGWTTSEVITPLVCSSSSTLHHDIGSRLLSFTIISSIIKHNSNLRYIDISKCALKEWMICKILQCLSSSRCLEHLNICNNVVSNSAANLLAVVIANNKNIHHLDLSNCQLQCSGLCKILDALKSINQLLYFDVSYNSISEEVGNEFAKFIGSNKHITHLCLCHCDLYEEDNFLLIAGSLVRLKTLKHLDLSYNIVSTRVASVLKNVVISNDHLDYVNFSHCWIAQEQITKICTGFSMLHLIRHLDVSNCEMHNHSVNSLENALASNKTLQHLDMSNCLLKVEGIIKIFQVLKATVSLRHLNLNSNFIRDVQDDPGHIEIAVKELTYVIKNNRLLKHFEISNCMLLGSHILCIAKALSKLLYLQHFNISHNEINDEAAFEVASVITNNTSLESLNVSHCSMREESIFMIANPLLSAKFLRSLNISNNCITERSAKAMYDTLHNTNTLKYLNFSHCGVLFDDTTSSLLTNWFNFKLVHLDLESTIVSDHAATVISSLLTLVGHVNLSSCNLKAVGLLTILATLKEVKTLQYLNLGSNQISYNNGCILCNVLCVNQNLQHLILPSCCLSPALIERIIKECRSLHFLDISHNSITYGTLSSLINHSVPLQYLNVNDYIEFFYDVGVQVDALTEALQNNYCKISVSNMITALITNFEVMIFEDNGFLESLCKVRPMYCFTLYRILNDIENYIAKVFTTTRIENFNLSYCSLKEHNLLLLFRAVMFTNALCYLILNSTRLGEAVTDALALVIKSNKKTLIHVSVSNCELCGQQIAIIAKALGQLSTLQYLDISSNQINDNAAIEIASAITNSTSLEYLNISNCNITEGGLQSIACALYCIIDSNNFYAKAMTTTIAPNDMLKAKNLKHLDISRNEVSYSHMLHYIFIILSKLNFIEFVDFSFNSKSWPVMMHSELQRVELQPIRNDALKHLDLSHCKLPDGDMSTVLLMLSKCTSLVYLNLSFCAISDNAALLEHVIVNNSHLNYLNLSDCKLYPQEIIVIVNALRKAPSVEHLLLNSNVITDKAAVEISLVIRSNICQLKQLALSDCELEEFGMQCIATALWRVSSLTHLDLSYNIISDAVANRIASAVSCNTSLQYLDMSYCTWPNNGLAIISKSLVDMSKLKEVDFTSL